MFLVVMVYFVRLSHIPTTYTSFIIKGLLFSDKLITNQLCLGCLGVQLCLIDHMFLIIVLN